MKKLKLNIMYFSPTGSTKKIVKAVAEGMDMDYTEFDLTYSRDLQKIHFGEDDLLVLAIPVYAGRIPQLLLDCFSSLKSENAYFLPIVVYGNRAIDDALIEVYDIFSKNGFITVGYGIFISEHSYSSQFATGRPDEADLEAAREYGKMIVERIGSCEDKSSIFTEEIPGNRPYREAMPAGLEWGPVASDKCTFCGDCIPICPVDAIGHMNPKKTDISKCIHCCACIKGCKENAKHNEGEYYTRIMHLLESKAKDRKEIVIK